MIFGPQRVFVDANVWYSRTLRDWLGMLYTTPDTPPFVVCWSEDVLAEAIYRLRKTHPEWDGSRITTIRDRIAGTFEGGRVDDYATDTEYLGRDPDDAHVHAAAVAGRADYLITFNTKDFQGNDDVAPYEVLTPDDFLVLVDTAMPGLVDRVTQLMSNHWIKLRGESDLAA